MLEDSVQNLTTGPEPIVLKYNLNQHWAFCVRFCTESNYGPSQRTHCTKVLGSCEGPRTQGPLNLNQQWPLRFIKFCTEF